MKNQETFSKHVLICDGCIPIIKTEHEIILFLLLEPNNLLHNGTDAETASFAIQDTNDV